MRLTDVGTPVTVAGMTVEPGDILHGDEHGVLQIPPEALPDLIAKAELIRDDERNVVTWSRSPDFTVPKLLELRRLRHLRSGACRMRTWCQGRRGGSSRHCDSTQECPLLFFQPFAYEPMIVKLPAGRPFR
jgi:hypothetical protein